MLRVAHHVGKRACYSVAAGCSVTDDTTRLLAVLLDCCVIVVTIFTPCNGIIVICDEQIISKLTRSDCVA